MGTTALLDRSVNMNDRVDGRLKELAQVCVIRRESDFGKPGVRPLQVTSAPKSPLLLRAGADGPQVWTLFHSVSDA